MKSNFDNYTVEFTRSMVRYGYKSYTWFVSRPNYDRSGFHSSDTVWCYSSDNISDVEYYFNPLTSKSDFIKFIKSRNTVKVSNSPIY